jgi:non-SMC mitotic condensation complex subunit 1
VCQRRGNGQPQLAVRPALQAQAWAALGKVSLVDEPLCRSTAPLMVAQLARSPHPAVRNNVLLALCDMCMQYTLLVDAHLGTIAAAMQDPHPLVRKQALALLASLLQREFIKWRGPLFVQCAPFQPSNMLTHTCAPLRIQCVSHLLYASDVHGAVLYAHARPLSAAAKQSPSPRAGTCSRSSTTRRRCARWRASCWRTC